MKDRILYIIAVSDRLLKLPRNDGLYRNSHLSALAVDLDDLSQCLS